MRHGNSSALPPTALPQNLSLKSSRLSVATAVPPSVPRQDLNDFFALEDGKYGKGIINNSKTKIVLNLEDEEAMRVQSILHLSEAETMAVTHFERGNGLISTNNNNVTVEFKASELEKELITTDREELKKLLEKEKRRQQMREAG